MSSYAIVYVNGMISSPNGQVYTHQLGWVSPEEIEVEENHEEE